MEAVRYASLMADAARFFPFGDMARDAYHEDAWRVPWNIHYNILLRARDKPVFQFNRDAVYDPAYNQLAAEIKAMYRFDEIAKRVIDTTDAVSPDEDLRRFMRAVTEVAHKYLKRDPQKPLSDRNVSHFATVDRGGKVFPKRPAHPYTHAMAVHIITRLCNECIDTIGGGFSVEKEKGRIRNLVGRSAKCGKLKPVKTKQQLDEVREAAKSGKRAYPPREEHFHMLFDHAWRTFDVARLVHESESVGDFERKFRSFVIQSTYIVCNDSGCAIL